MASAPLTTEQLFTANREAINAAAIAPAYRSRLTQEALQTQVKMTRYISRRRNDYAVRWYGRDPSDCLSPLDGEIAADFARRAASLLTSDQRLALAIHLIDNLDGVDDDARNDAVNAMGELA